MSYVRPELLKGILDPTIAFVVSTFPFLLAQLKTDCVSQFGGLARKFRIVNQDAVNNLTYRQGAADSVLKTVPPNSEVLVEGWESYIEINPNAGTGAGFLEIDVVPLSVAKK